MCDLYIKKTHVFEYWKYDQDYTPDKLPEWIKNDKDLEIIQHGEKLIMLDGTESCYEEVWYDDYVLYNKGFESMECFGDGDVVIQEHNISDRFVPYDDNLMLQKNCIIEAYHYSDTNDCNIPDWVKAKILTSLDNNDLYVLLHPNRCYKLSVGDYIYRYITSTDKEVVYTTSSFGNEYIKLNEDALNIE